jgi:hypothetical protein
LATGADGKVNIKCERPQLTQYLRSTVAAGSTQLAIEDVDAWDALTVPRLYCLVGVGLSTAETARVSSTEYSTVGNTITLARTVTGTITATVSGATLSGATSSTPATGTVTIGGTITAGNSVTITLDGVASQYTVTAADTTGTIAAMMATVINANASINRYIKATWSSASPTVVTISSKLGFLNLAAGTTNSHSITEEVMHIHYAFSSASGGALSSGNILKDSFEWSEAGREPEYNQFVIKYQDAAADFAETELIENDYTRQATTNQPIKLEINGAAVDSYDQANRLVVGARYKYGEDKFFASWASAGYATLLEVGDVVSVHHHSMPLKYNVPVIIEEIAHQPNHSVTIIGRRYRKEMFPETSATTTIPLVTSVTWPTNAPGQPTSLTLTTPANGTVRGTFNFAVYPGHQLGRVEVKKAGSGAFVDTGIRVEPNGSNVGTFEIPGLPGGSTEVKVIPINDLLSEGTASATSTITVIGTNGTEYTFTAATTWTINHNFGYNPRAVLFDSSGAEIDGAVTNPTVNQTVINWNVSQAGRARLF